ncbi:MAG: hypothetical protein IJZ59_06390 [Alphaproteobacteria bacterium]|nr:hypothetical protein [Alphaproteobacteria bacterium]
MNVMENIEKENQLRKMRQYVNQLTLPEKVITFLKECYDFVKKDMGLIDNRYQFSEQFLNSNKFYLGKLVCENKAPSLSCISTLIQNLAILKDLPNIDTSIIEKIDDLIAEGQQLINQKLLR